MTHTKHLLKIFILATVTIILAASLFGCVTDDKVLEKNVSFGDGTQQTSQKYYEGAQIVMPECEYQKEGYVFLGWSDGNATYSAGETYTVGKESVAFTVKWGKAVLELKFYDTDGSLLWSTQVNSGNGLRGGYGGDDPTRPENTEYKTYDWDINDGWEQPIPSKITEDMEFRPKFTEKTRFYVYKFFIEGQPTAHKTFDNGKWGELVSRPSDPVKTPIDGDLVVVARYEFLGWKLQGDDDSVLIANFDSGRLDYRLNNANLQFVAVFRAIPRLYSLQANINPEQATITVGNSVEANGSISFAITLKEAYSKSIPTATVQYDNGKTETILLGKNEDGTFTGKVSDMTSNGILTVDGITRNIYTLTKGEILNARADFKTEYEHGENGLILVIPNPHYDQTMPVVTYGGKTLSGEKITTEDGRTAYQFAIIVLNDAVVTVNCVANMYSVQFYNGTVLEKDWKGTHEEVLTVGSALKDATPGIVYTFKGWQLKSDPSKPLLSNGAQIGVTQNDVYQAVFTESVRKYEIVFLGREGERLPASGQYEYLAVVLDVAPRLQEVIEQPQWTYTFKGWKNADGALIGRDVKVGANSAESTAYSAFYKSELTEYQFKLNYLKDGQAVEEQITLHYQDNIFNALPKSTAVEGKRYVWTDNSGNALSQEAVVTADGELTAQYDWLQFTVRFFDAKNTVIKQDEVQWGTAAIAPSESLNYMTEQTVYTFSGWDKVFTEVKQTLDIYPVFVETERVYKVILNDEVGKAWFVIDETSGDRTYQSLYKFKIRLAESIDPTEVKVLQRGNTVALTADAEGYYSITIIADTEVYFDGVGNKKIVIELPDGGEAYTLHAEGSLIVSYGQPFRFNLVAGVAYTQGVFSVRVNGTEVTAVNGFYTVDTVTETLLIEVEVPEKNRYDAIVALGEGVTAENTQSSVAHGDSVTFNVQILQHYRTGGLKYTVQPGVTVQASVDGTYTVTFANVNANKTFAVSAERNRYRITVDGIHFTVTDKSGDLTAAIAEESVWLIVKMDEGYSAQAPEILGATVENLGGGSYRLTVEALSDITVTVKAKINLYNLNTEGDQFVTVTTAEKVLEHGATAQVTITLKEGTNPASLVVKVNGVSATPTLQDGVFVLTLTVTQDVTVNVTAALFVYNVTAPSTAEQSSNSYALLNIPSSVQYGKNIAFTVQLQESVNATAPVVKVNNQIITPVEKNGNEYEYRVLAVKNNLAVAVLTTVNVYEVVFAYPDGDQLKQVRHGDFITLPKALVDTDTETYFTVVSGWTNGAGTSFPIDLNAENLVCIRNASFTAIWHSRYFVAKVGTQKFAYIEDAIEQTTQGEIELLVPGTDTAIELGGSKVVSFDRPGEKRSFGLAKGVTLKLPIVDSKYSDFADNDNRFNPSTEQLDYADNNENAFLKYVLTLPVGYELNVYGEIQISGVLSSKSQMRQGQTSGDYAQLTVDGTLNVYGLLKTFGYVKGTGTVNAKSGSEVWSPLVIEDFAGGSHTSSANSAKISPFNMFTMANVQPRLFRIEYGAWEKGYAVLWTSSPAQYNRTVADMIAPSEKATGVLRMEPGSVIEKRTSRIAGGKGQVVPITDITIFGNVQDGAMKLTIKVVIFTVTVSTADYLLPLSFMHRINVASGGTVTLNMRYKLLPGFAIHVQEGGKVIANNEIIGYQNFVNTIAGANPELNQITLKDLNYYVYTYDKFIPSSYKVGTGFKASEMEVDGTLEINAKFGGIVTGKGTVVFGANAVNGTSSGDFAKPETFQTVTEAARGLVGGVLQNFVVGNTYQLG